MTLWSKEMPKTNTWHFEAKKWLRQIRGTLKQRNDKDKYVIPWGNEILLRQTRVCFKVPRVCLNYFFASRCHVFVLTISLLQSAMCLSWVFLCFKVPRVCLNYFFASKSWHLEAKKLFRQTRGILKQRNDKDKYVALWSKEMIKTNTWHFEAKKW
jgi:hypothetical protein